MAEPVKRIYFDNAATTRVRPEVLEAVIPVLSGVYGNPSSLYRSAREARITMENARKTLAACIGASHEEVYFTASGTESDNWAIKSAARMNASKGRHIVTTAIEHHAVLHAFRTLEREGWEATYVGVDGDGLVDPEEVRRAIRPDTTLVSVMMANNEIGTIQPIARIGAICREKKVLFHTDAVQAAGSVPIDVKELQVDMLSATGHKIYAPKGVGMLYIRRGLRLPPFLDGGGQEKARRAGTENVPFIAGYARAFELAVAEMESSSERLSSMRDEMIAKILARIPHCRLNGHPTQRLPGNVNISFDYIEGESMLLLLDSMGYECSTGSACTSGSLEPSHVLLAIGLPHEQAHGSLRISLGKFNNREEIDPFVEALAQVVQRLREMSPLYKAE
ncbi:MAG: cysteine desulfurase NifS [Clostridia bacterium]|nr:cysteine desulfurase NifS [Clostridia bacterium]